MTRALAFVFLLGCARTSESPAPPGGGLFDCIDRGGCSANLVCTRDNQCLTADQVHTVHVLWTVSGAAASAATCAGAPDLELSLRGRNVGGLSFAPVPCAEGEFTVDRLSDAFDRVELGRVQSRDAQSAAIDASGDAMLDLPY